MAIIIKTEKELELMREAGVCMSKVHSFVETLIRPGISTYDLDQEIEAYIRSLGCIPTEKGYEGYPASICASVNNVVVHGIPRKDIILKEGDIISVDITLAKNGYQSDACRTLPVGKVSEEAERLMRVTKESFFKATQQAYVGNHLFDISAAMDEYVIKNGYSTVRDLTGHGIGKDMHEDPMVPCYKQKRRGPKLVHGMTICIEPMVNQGTWQLYYSNDDENWTLETADGRLSSHYENTIAITNEGPEILTLTEGEEIPEFFKNDLHINKHML
ncbi:MAG TPA: type I methionyl aminopeptidase [Lachnospiraceae bacterium]|jgi:methionyl aminopeptidase|nr:type I methionyl aminopeptidase [Lachnospiraceae bacterium]HBZ89982.1 type I methionyl aminopeptidase [Lachnospiraceae bacterium]